MQQDNQNQQGNKRADQLRKPMESQANKPAMDRPTSDSETGSDRRTDGQNPPTTDYNQEKHWVADKGQKTSMQAQSQTNGQTQIGIQQDFKRQQDAGDVQANQAQESGQNYQSEEGVVSQRQAGIADQQQRSGAVPQQQSNRPTEDRSKSFGESEVPAGGEVDHSDDDGVIPKENSFPNFSNPSGQAKEDYTH